MQIAVRGGRQLFHGACPAASPHGNTEYGGAGALPAPPVDKALEGLPAEGTACRSGRFSVRGPGPIVGLCGGSDETVATHAPGDQNGSQGAVP